VKDKSDLAKEPQMHLIYVFPAMVFGGLFIAFAVRSAGAVAGRTTRGAT
jgi:hypothetical protein